jgi:hypothetical protein
MAPAWFRTLDKGDSSVSIRRLTGCWLVLARAGDAEAERRFYLESEVPERDEWPSISSGFEPLGEVAVGSEGALPCVPLIPKEAPPSSCLLDLMEALYARGSSTMAEAEFVEIVSRTLPDRRRVWDVMRAFAEAGWAEVSVALSWRARRWRLCPPRLIDMANEKVLVEGALSAAARRRLTEAAQALGGRIVSNGELQWSPDIVVVVGVAAEILASATGWPAIVAEPLGLSAAPACWPAEPRSTEGRELASVWSFEAGRFLSEAEAFGPWRLERWARGRGDDRDVFRLIGPRGEWTTTVRTAAILEIHRLAQRPLFTKSGNVLTRLAGDGHIPLPVALSLRRTMLRQSGPTTDPAGRWTYQYPASAPATDWLAKRFGAVAARQSG